MKKINWHYRGLFPIHLNIVTWFLGLVWFWFYFRHNPEFVGTEEAEVERFYEDL